MSSTGERLVALRERFGMSQAQVAATIGVDRTSYAKYEKGVNKPTRKLKELSDLFKLKKPPRRTAIKRKRAFRIWISK